MMFRGRIFNQAGAIAPATFLFNGYSFTPTVEAVTFKPRVQVIFFM